MSKRTVLTGITTTGTPHLGNYVGAIKPCIQASHDPDVQSYYFLADFHSLVKNQDPDRIRQSTLEIAATWLALGLDTERSVFYRQSDIPEIPELTWILTCSTAKGLMNRAHAYKAAVQENLDAGEDADFAITMGLFSYPVLMAADILMFNSTHVPVGKDQVQHLEMARDIAQRFNHHYGELFELPEAVVEDHVAVLPGKDGRKMSKSYNNTIPLWLPEKQLRKAIMKIVTNSLEPGEPKDPDDSALFAIYAAFASREQRGAMRQAYRDGIGWGQAKQETFDLINRELLPGRERYEALIAEPARIEEALQEGAEKARAFATPFLQKIRRSVGIRQLV
ncbi:MAG: tryptophan--tRNA ligase [Xanthomonadales bacterium]|nr:tryptophan--tRNA ligase [Gammaproteobacteria bacterium]MBT8052652.1 tryptophan--tRNA ligase [Gammaproteobacteria bacterium]NND56589.1 tryptophan--tRNA ligase [Xanthomonadales bacterium]NNK52469.1 tryptophan--tRNA ligase [Xanthomonadales bacterium]